MILQFGVTAVSDGCVLIGVMFGIIVPMLIR